MRVVEVYEGFSDFHFYDLNLIFEYQECDLIVII